MFNNGTNENHDHDHDDAAGAALIDSFFLPGGILDPESEENNGNPSDSANPNPNQDTHVSNQSQSARTGRRFNQHQHQQQMDQGHAHGQGSLDMNNPEALRSRLEQIAIGGQALEYEYNPNGAISSSHSAITMPRSSMMTSPSQEPPRVGVAALDPTSDDVVGGRPILMNSSGSVPLSMHSSSSSQLPASAAGTGTVPSSSVIDGIHQMPMPGQQVHASPNEYNSDWFSGLLPLPSPTSGPPTIQEQHRHQPQYPTRAFSSTSSTGNESRTTSATSTRTSHIHRNPWSNEDLSELKPQNQVSSSHNHLRYGSPTYTVPEPTDMDMDMDTPASTPLGNFQSTNPLTSKRSGSIRTPPPVTQAGVRPPPGFLPSSAPSQPQQVASSVTDQRQRATQQQQQHSIRTKEISRAAPLSSTRQHQNSNPYRHQHQHEQVNNVQQQQVRHVEQNNVRQTRHVEHHQHQPVQRKTKTVHYNDGDYDLSSLNTKSSRDIPSTIYVEEDTQSTSEDTLTVCADSASVTEVSVQTVQKTTASKIMEVLEETSAIEQKRNKPKRNKKRRTKKKQNVQESVKSQDTSTSAHDIVQRTIAGMDENKQKSDSEEESEETKKTPKSYKKSHVNHKPSGSLKSPSNSRSSAATTAISSTATTVQRTAKRSHNPKAAHLDRNQNRTDDSRRIHREVKPREPLSESFSRWMDKGLPVVLNALFMLVSFINSSGKFMMKACMTCFPRKERFWFFLPAFCVMVDFYFLACTIVAKAFGQIVYMLVMVHKLALLELMESDSAASCYTVIYFYPNIVSAAKVAIPYQDYWPVFVRWLAVDRWLCRAITMKDTYLYRLKKRDRRESEMNIVKLYLITGEHLIGSLKDAASHILRSSKQAEQEESERVTMANHILLILRKMTPLILMLEVNIRREGFLVLMTSTERILFGYGFAVLRSGYLFSPLIWISWTIQLTIIMFVVPSPSWSYFVFVLGLVSIRLSHYTSAVEDLEGINAMNRNATSRFRKNASRLKP